MSRSFFDEYYDEMLPKIHKYIYARFPCDLAEDLANETMLTLWTKDVDAPKNADELRQLRAFTYSIAFNLMLNAQRKAERGARALDRGVLQVGGSTDDPTYEAVAPLALAADIRSLDAGTRHVINLLIAGFGTSEIADILAVTPKAASMRVSRARGRLEDLRRRCDEEVNDGAER